MCSGGRKHMSVKDFVEGINESDASIEANLATVLQSVRGTKQFWFLKKVMSWQWYVNMDHQLSF